MQRRAVGRAAGRQRAGGAARLAARDRRRRFASAPGSSSSIRTRSTAKVGQPLILVLTSEDRIHGFKMPELGIRTDIVPGQETRVTLTPDKAGQLRLPLRRLLRRRPRGHGRHADRRGVSRLRLLQQRAQHAAQDQTRRSSADRRPWPPRARRRWSRCAPPILAIVVPIASLRLGRRPRPRRRRRGSGLRLAQARLGLRLGRFRLRDARAAPRTRRGRRPAAAWHRTGRAGPAAARRPARHARPGRRWPGPVSTS